MAPKEKNGLRSEIYISLYTILMYLKDRLKCL
jgi:hypothetical protein